MKIEAAFLAACAEELSAPKPGNVHVHAAGHGMSVADFARSAAVSAPLLCAPGAPLGRRIRDAAAATRDAVGQNTNLGILLLCGPLAMAAECRVADLRQAVVRVIAASDLADAEDVFAAIRIARPGGLGTAARHDVNAPAAVRLGEAMAEAASRDSVARQWSHGFADVFGGGMDAYAEGRARWPSLGGNHPAWAAVMAYLHFLAGFPDSHVQRKHGAAVAAGLQSESRRFAGEFSACTDPRTLLPGLLAWDAVLKADGINPGTSADLTVATAFAWHLQNGAPAEWLALPR